MKKLLILLFLFGISFAIQAQEKREKAHPNSRDSYDYTGETQYKPEKEKKGIFSNIFKKKQKNNYNARFNWDERLRKEWEQRMEANAKKYNKMAKEMKKPQYSDPLYFGHKQKPKKRPPGKKKYCNECGIVH